MMTTLFLALSLYLSPATTDTRFVNPPCETVGPRLDGSMVEICGGKVVHVFILGEVAPAGVTVVTFDDDRE